MIAFIREAGEEVARYVQLFVFEGHRMAPSLLAADFGRRFT